MGTDDTSKKGIEQQHITLVVRMRVWKSVWEEYETLTRKRRRRERMRGRK